MKPEASRRMFIGSIALGVPLLAGGGVAALAQSSRGKDTGQEHAHGSSQKDAVFDHILKQIGTITQAAKRRGGSLTVDEALVSAAYLRTFAVHARELDFDRIAADAIRARIDKEGRDTLLYEPPDRARIRAHLQTAGIELDDRFLAVPDQVDYATRAAALDTIVKGGATTLFDRAVTGLEAAVPHLQQQAKALRQVQYDYYWYYGYCQQLENEISTLTMTATAVCNTYVVMPWMEPFCLGLYGTIAVLVAAWWYECSWLAWGIFGF